MSKNFFIGVDSDGTAFDSMRLKHYAAFIPAAIQVWHLEDHEAWVTEAEARINLYSKSRGVNRFPGLLILFEELKENGIEVGDTTELKNFVDDTPVYSNSALEAYLKEHPDPLLEQVLEWSLLADRLFAKAVEGQRPFEGVKECFSKVYNQADVFVISSASMDSLTHDWREGGLLTYVTRVCGQESGSKKQQLENEIDHYKKQNMILLGDAPGDEKAARDLGIWFFPICPGKEEASWKEFSEMGVKKLFEGSFDTDYQEELLEKFNESLLSEVEK